MAKTFKTRPAWVRVLDKPRYLEAAHDHTTGPCDLPAADRDAFDKRSRTRCQWWYADCAWYELGNLCGCRMCTGHFPRKWANRRSRYAARRYAHEGWREEY